MAARILSETGRRTAATYIAFGSAASHREPGIESPGDEDNGVENEDEQDADKSNGGIENEPDENQSGIENENK